MDRPTPAIAQMCETKAEAFAKGTRSGICKLIYQDYPLALFLEDNRSAAVPGSLNCSTPRNSLESSDVAVTEKNLREDQMRLNSSLVMGNILLFKILRFDFEIEQVVALIMS